MTTVAVFQLPATVPGAEKTNPQLATSQKLTTQQNYEAALSEYPGDPDSNKTVPGTTLAFNSLTETQYQLLQANIEGGMAPADLQSLLEANPGPSGADDPTGWNLSYDGWGVTPAKTFDPSVQTATGFIVGNGAQVTVITRG